MGDVFLMLGFLLMAAAAAAGGVVFVHRKQKHSPAWAGFDRLGTAVGYFRDGWRVALKESWLILLPLGLYIAHFFLSRLIYFVTLRWLGYDGELFFQNIATPPAGSLFQYLHTILGVPNALHSGLYTIIFDNLLMAFGTLLAVCLFWMTKRTFRNMIVASNMHNVSFLQAILQFTCIGIPVVAVLQFLIPLDSVAAELPRGLVRLGIFSGLAGLAGVIAFLAVGSVIQGSIIVSAIFGIRGERLSRRRILNQALLKLRPLMKLNVILFVSVWTLKMVSVFLERYVHLYATVIPQMLLSILTALTMCIPFAVIMTERNVRGALRKTFRVIGANKWRYIQLVGIGTLVLTVPKLLQLVLGSMLQGYAYLGICVVLESLTLVLSVIFMTGLLKFFLAYYDVDGWEVEFAAFEREAACSEEESGEDTSGECG